MTNYKRHCGLNNEISQIPNNEQDYQTKMQRNYLSKPQCRNCNGYGHYQRDCIRQGPSAELSPQPFIQNLASPSNLAFKGNNYNAAKLYARPFSQYKVFPARKAKLNGPLKLNCSQGGKPNLTKTLYRRTNHVL